MGTRSSIVGLISCLVAACGADPRDATDGATDAERETATEASVLASDGGSGAAVDAARAFDAARAPGLDGARERPDASSAADAQSAAPDTGLDATFASDARVTPRDAGLASCSIDAGAADGSCAGFVCSAEAGTFVNLHQEQAWYVGGLEWSAAVCSRELGWPTARTPDGRDLLFALSPHDVRELAAGAPLFVGWGSPYTSRDERSGRCTITVQSPPVACPGTPSKHRSLLGCRGPSDPGCAACSVPIEGTSELSYRSSSSGADWYNHSSTTVPPACATSCLPCAGCSYSDQKQIEALPVRPECEPCSGNFSPDPCFEAESCACWCAKGQLLRSACPTLAP